MIYITNGAIHPQREGGVTDQYVAEAGPCLCGFPVPPLPVNSVVPPSHSCSSCSRTTNTNHHSRASEPSSGPPLHCVKSPLWVSTLVHTQLLMCAVGIHSIRLPSQIMCLIQLPVTLVSSCTVSVSAAVTMLLAKEVSQQKTRLLSRRGGYQEVKCRCNACVHCF